MHRLMASFRKVQSHMGKIPHRLVFKGTLGALAVGGALALTTVSAKDPVEKGTRSGNDRAVLQTAAQAESVVIPECLEKLKLSAQQQEQVRKIVNDYNVPLKTVWKQFGDRYMQAIEMECSLLAAIEDNLTEPQRQQVRSERRKTAKYEKSVAMTDDKPNRATTKPDSAAKSDTAVEEDLSEIGIKLTAEQAAAADQIQDRYRSHLRSLNRDIEGLHTRLVSLEADKFVEIEKVLTKEQLAELRASRQAAPDSPRATVTEASPTTR